MDEVIATIYNTNKKNKHTNKQKNLERKASVAMTNSNAKA